MNNISMLKPEGGAQKSLMIFLGEGVELIKESY